MYKTAKTISKINETKTNFDMNASSIIAKSTIYETALDEDA